MGEPILFYGSEKLKEQRINGEVVLKKQIIAFLRRIENCTFDKIRSNDTAREFEPNGYNNINRMESRCEKNNSRKNTEWSHELRTQGKMGSWNKVEFRVEEIPNTAKGY